MDNADSYYITLAVSLAALLCFSAFFSASEMAFSSLNRIKLKNLAAKNRRAALALKLLDIYDKLLSSVLIGNNIVNITSSALATVLFVGLFGAKGVTITTIVMTLAVLVFGEISPKTLAKESPELTALRVAPLLRFFVIVFTPLNYLAGAWRKVIVKIFPVKGDRSVTEDELLTFVEEVRQEGGINKQEEEMIRQVIEFDDLTAGEIFTPRIDVSAVSENDTAGEIDRKFAETGFSRLPVYRENIDNIIGVILLKDFHHEVMRDKKTVAEIMKPVVFVTKTIKISKLLRTLQQKQAHLAVLVDEFGGTLGIVTIEDIVEELVGEIWDEHDEIVEPVKKNPDGSFTVIGSANLQDMLEYTGSGGGETGDIPNTTVGSWVMEKTGGIPRSGEQFVWCNLQIRVTRVLRHRVMEITVNVIDGRESGEQSRG
ncbi:MAG: hemolysin family protein [Treponema sp.]|jgi:CBS domain containing-hemolysin-like protein|nr:hemolysin family protein [Treponema sp.]